jgi:catechol 2,3-dioxygenase-like lactoylglutathione lyase family enzyme
MQAGFIVDDVPAALRYWIDVMGAGPFFVMEAKEWSVLTYKGIPTDVHMRLTLGHWGALQLEFIEQLNEASSPYKDFRASGMRGLHHFGILVDDLAGEAALLAERGKNVVYQGSTPQGFRFAYLVDDEHPGAMIELIERGPAANALMTMVADAARGWDGSEPLRYL